MGLALKDTQMKATKTLPAAASTTVYSTGIDLGHGAFGDVIAPFELKLTAPAVTTTMAPDTKTITYSIVSAATSDLSSSPTVLIASCIVQTGAGGAGAATSSFTCRLPVDVQRYVGVRIVSGADITDSSAVSATVELLF